jgi:regulator of cell morphogenesis and NO signaling
MVEHPITTQSLNADATVNEILTAHPAAVAVFNSFGIDACCGGDASLSEAARRDGANVDALRAALDELIVRGETR